MSVLVNKDTRLVVQGITGGAGSFHARLCMEYGTQIVAGVTPGKGGETVLGRPVFNTVREAVEATGAEASLLSANPGSGDGRKRNTISLDQYLAPERYPLRECDRARRAVVRLRLVDELRVPQNLEVTRRVQIERQDLSDVFGSHGAARTPEQRKRDRYSLTRAFLDAQVDVLSARRARRHRGEGEVPFAVDRDGELHTLTADDETVLAELQIALIREEAKSLKSLLDKGHTDRPRYLALQREAARLEGERGEHISAIARTTNEIGETRLQIIQLERSAMKWPFLPEKFSFFVQGNHEARFYTLRRHIFSFGADYSIYNQKGRKIGILDHQLINLGGAWMVRIDPDHQQTDRHLDQQEEQGDEPVQCDGDAAPALPGVPAHGDVLPRLSSSIGPTWIGPPAFTVPEQPPGLRHPSSGLPKWVL